VSHPTKLGWAAHPAHPVAPPWPPGTGNPSYATDRAFTVLYILTTFVFLVVSLAYRFEYSTRHCIRNYPTAATYVWCQYGAVETSTSVEYRFSGGAAEVVGVVVRGARGAASSDVTLVHLVTWAVDVLGAVDATAVPRCILTRARRTDSTASLTYG